MNRMLRQPALELYFSILESVQVITGKATFPPEIPKSPFGEEPEAVWHEGSNCVALNDTKTTYSVFSDPKVFLKE